MSALFGRRLLGVALLAATFLAGALSGAALDRALSGGDSSARDDRTSDRRQSYIIDQVDMTSEQRAAIDSILERRSERMRAIWGDVRPHLDAVTDSARTEIMEVLTSEQQAEYERLLENRRGGRRDRDSASEAGDGTG